MNENLSNILDGIGITPQQFQSQQSFLASSPNITMQGDIQATTDPQEIEDTLQNPDTIYAAISEHQEENEEAVNNSSPITNNSQLTTNDSPSFSDDDFDNLLTNIGMNDDEPIQEIAEAVEVEQIETSDNPQLTTNNSATHIIPISSTEEENPEEIIEIRENIDASQSTNSQLIPPNSPSLLADEATSRFSGTSWYDNIKKTHVLIAGIGGIGSNLAYQIARLQPASLHLYDADIIELSNLSGQLFSQHDVGKAKVDAMADFIQKYTTTSNIMGVQEHYDYSKPATDIMMCGFDNMSARKRFFNMWLEHVNALPDERKKQCLFLDGRLSIDTLQVFTITGDDDYNRQRYFEKYLFYDYEADRTICSMKQTTYLACMIGSVMTNLFVNFVANSTEDGMYDLPFFTQYDAQNMIFKTLQ